MMAPDLLYTCETLMVDQTAVRNEESKECEWSSSKRSKAV